jgi:hypothetical protein
VVAGFNGIWCEKSAWKSAWSGHQSEASFLTLKLVRARRLNTVSWLETLVGRVVWIKECEACVWYAGILARGRLVCRNLTMSVWLGLVWQVMRLGQVVVAGRCGSCVGLGTRKFSRQRGFWGLQMSTAPWVGRVQMSDSNGVPAGFKMSRLQASEELYWCCCGGGFGAPFGGRRPRREICSFNE